MSALRAVPVPDETPKPRTFSSKAFVRAESDVGHSMITIPRRTPQPKDVQIEILYCGICHTDIHFVRNEFENAIPTSYPCVPGRGLLDAW